MGSGMSGRNSRSCRDSAIETMTKNNKSAKLVKVKVKTGGELTVR